MIARQDTVLGKCTSLRYAATLGLCVATFKADAQFCIAVLLIQQAQLALGMHELHLSPSGHVLRGACIARYTATHGVIKLSKMLSCVCLQPEMTPTLCLQVCHGKPETDTDKYWLVDAANFAMEMIEMLQ